MLTVAGEGRQLLAPLPWCGASAALHPQRGGQWIPGARPQVGRARRGGPRAPPV